MDYRPGKPAKLFTDATVSGSWTPLTEKTNTNNEPGIRITALRWASGSYTTDKISGSRQDPFGESKILLDYPAFREPGTSGPSGLLGSGYYKRPPSGSFLQLKDANGDIVYTTYSDGTPSPVDGGAIIESRGIGSELVFQLPLYYWCSNSGESDMIRVWGEYK